jgi:hypothetical protein
VTAKYQLITVKKTNYPVPWMYRLLEIIRQGFYAWLRQSGPTPAQARSGWAAVHTAGRDIVLGRGYQLP